MKPIEVRRLSCVRVVIVIVLALAIPFTQSACGSGTLHEVCEDSDLGGSGDGPGCRGTDRDPCDASCVEAGCCAAVLGCADDDGDGYGAGIECLGPDCNDSEDGCWTGSCCAELPPTCDDADGDHYGMGPGCEGSDCDDGDGACWSGTCCGAAPPVDGLLALCISTAATIIEVSTPAQLRSALSSATPGDRIVVAPGSYSGTYTMARSGTDTQPIVLDGDKRAKLVGPVVISGDYNVVTGFEMTGSARISIEGGDFNRVTRNHIHHYSGNAVVSNKGDFNRVDHNEISDQLIGGHRGIVFSVNRNDPNFGHDNRIDHNYLHDLPDQERNGTEPIYSGSGLGTWMPTNLVIDHNLLVGADSDGEVIGIKTSSNRIIGNTILDSRSYISNRNGNDNVWESNWLENTGFRIYGRNSKIIGNNMNGRTIWLLTGTTSQQELQDSYKAHGNIRQPSQPYAENTLVVGNRAGVIDLGTKYGSPLPVKDTTLEANIATIVKANEVGTSTSNSTSVEFRPAVKLSPRDVGVDAIDPSCD